MIFADTITSSDTPIVVGAFVTVIGGFLAIARIMLGAATREREADRKERKELSVAINTLAKSHGAQASATKDLVTETRKGNQEAKERNGHLGEQSMQLANMIKDNTTVVLDAVQHIGEQHIEKQTIDKQVIHKSK